MKVSRAVKNVPRVTTGKPCSGKCGGVRDLSYSRYCRACRNRRSRAKRPRHSELLPEVRKRANCRSYTNTLIARGELIPQPCEDCGATEEIQAHHDYYDKPREVRWKCKGCHRKRHRPDRAPVCSDCGGANDCADKGQAYCRACHAKHMREYRAEQKASQRKMLAELDSLRRKVSA